MKPKPASRRSGRVTERMLGSIYGGPDRYQDRRYAARVERLMAEREAKQAQQEKDRANG